MADDDFCMVVLRHGEVMLVDSSDYSFITQWQWFAVKDRNTWYARRYEGRSLIQVHQVLCPTPEGLVPDHRNGNGLDNRRSNLRVATLSQNQANRIHLNHNKTSKYRGVCWDKGARSWRADLMFEQRNRYLGLHPNEESAARAYDTAATKYFGEFARLNFPIQEPLPPGRATVVGQSTVHGG